MLFRIYLQIAFLFIKREPSDVQFATRFDDSRRDPGNSSVGRDDEVDRKYSFETGIDTEKVGTDREIFDLKSKARQLSNH